MPISSGAHQSPIDIVRADVVDRRDLPALAVHYPTGSVPVEVCFAVVDGDDGPDGPIVTPQLVVTVPVASGAHAKLGATRFDLQSFHWHSPSEHLIDGESFPLELHLVHRSAERALLVLGVLSRKGEEDRAIGPVFECIDSFDRNAPGNGRSDCRSVSVAVADLLPDVSRTYRYDGSLTTAPFTEGVSWFVCAATRTASPDQIEVHMDLVSTVLEGFGSRPQVRGNARAVRPLQGRVVTTGG